MPSGRLCYKSTTAVESFLGSDLELVYDCCLVPANGLGSCLFIFTPNDLMVIQRCNNFFISCRSSASVAGQEGLHNNGVNVCSFHDDLFLMMQRCLGNEAFTIA